MEPLECLTHAPQFSKLDEHELYRFADPSVGMKHDLIYGIAGIPNRKRFEQFAAERFGLLPCQHSLAYNLELDDADCPFDAKRQLIVEIIITVDLFRVTDQRSKDLAYLQPPTPILVRSG